MQRKLSVAFAVVLSAVGLGSCGGFSSPASTSSIVAVTINNPPASIAVNATHQFTATVTESTTAAGFFIGNGGQPGSTSSGTITTAGLFTAPATPPIYLNNETVQGAVQGAVTIEASVPGFNISAYAPFVNVPITAPSVTAGISPTTASVALGATQKFIPYAVGNVNGAFTLAVNGTVNGSSTVGTITSVVSTTIGTSPVYSYTTYTYTAPATMPMSGSTVTLTVTSAADPTKSASSVITLH